VLGASCAFAAINAVSYMTEKKDLSEFMLMIKEKVKAEVAARPLSHSGPLCLDEAQRFPHDWLQARQR
jgi:hypothetical protein